MRKLLGIIMVFFCLNTVYSMHRLSRPLFKTARFLHSGYFNTRRLQTSNQDVTEYKSTEEEFKAQYTQVHQMWKKGINATTELTKLCTNCSGHIPFFDAYIVAKTFLNRCKNSGQLTEFDLKVIQTARTKICGVRKIANDNVTVCCLQPHYDEFEKEMRHLYGMKLLKSGNQ